MLNLLVKYKKYAIIAIKRWRKYEKEKKIAHLSSENRNSNKYMQVKFKPLMHSEECIAYITKKNAITDKHIPCTLKKLCRIKHGTIIRTGITCKKILL